MKNKRKRTVPKNALYKNVVNLWEAIPRTTENEPPVSADLPPQTPQAPRRIDL